jgi:hypothetical protein
LSISISLVLDGDIVCRAIRASRELEKALMCSLCGNPVHLNYDFSLFRPPSQPAPSISTPQGIAEAIGALDKGADLGPITEKIKRLEAERKARIEKDLAGLADLEVLKGTKGRRFVIAYWDISAHTAPGIEYPKESDGYTVYVHGFGSSVLGYYTSMAALRKVLEERKIPYHIAYFDT